MVVHFLTSVAGLARWSDYIPVKLVQGGPENSYSGTIDVAVIPSLTANTQAWKEYIPVYADDSATDAWTVNNIGYIPYNYALFNDAAMQLDLTNGAALDPRITFSRTTNATVTGSNGLIQYAPHNLLTFSEQFDNAAWGKIAFGTGTLPVVTANAAVAPDGTTTADQVVFNRGAGTSSSDVSYLNFSLTAFTATATASVYLKTTDGTTKTMSFRCGAPAAQQITVTGEWQRFTLTQTNATIDRVQILLYGIDGAQTVSVYVWGAQLEVGSTATTYNPTTVKNLLGFTEHFDNAAWTKSNSFVQTNLLLHSQEFDNAYWGTSNTSVVADVETAPDGTLTADKLVENTATNFHLVQRVNGVPVGTYTISVFAKKAEREFMLLSFGIDFAVGVNLTTGAVVETIGSGAASSVTDVGNGWYRVSLTGTTTTLRNANIYVSQDGVLANRVYEGDGTSGIFIWGAQLVQGTSAGDYKATYAAAAAVGYTDIYGQPFAQKLVEDTANTTHQLQQNATYTAGVAYTYSFYAKKAERSVIRMFENILQGIEYAEFNLDTGVASILGPTIGWTLNAVSMQNSGNGWYRCAVTATPGSTVTNNAFISRLRLYNGTTTSYTGDGTSGIYIFGAQLSDSASVDPYVYQPVAAPASTAYYGPRFDYDPVTLAPKGLLIEEQRTQLLTFSEQFDNAAWIKSAFTTVTANTTVAPDGTTTADTLTNAGNGAKFIAQNVTVSAGATVFSVFAKAGTHNFVQLAFGVQSGTFANFDITAGSGVVGSSGGIISSSITDVGNGWYRCAVVFTNVNISTAAIAMVPSATATRIQAWTSDGTETVFAWGAQLEVGAFATSYIPSVASQVTRAADSASMIGNNFARWYNVNAGSLFAQYSVNGLNPSLANAAYGISDNTTNNFLVGRTLSSEATNFQVRVGGVIPANLNSVTVAVGVVAKIAGAYALNDFAFSANAGTVQTDTSGTLPFVTQMQIGGLTSSVNPLNGTISRIAFYGRRLADSELIGITS
jgi:plastocyanin